MRITLADLAAREAFLEMEATESILEKKRESKPFVVSHNIVATRPAQLIAAKTPNPSRRFRVFVASRLSVIYEHSNVSQWRYVDTKNNPADMAFERVITG